MSAGETVRSPWAKYQIEIPCALASASNHLPHATALNWHLGWSLTGGSTVLQPQVRSATAKNVHPGGAKWCQKEHFSFHFAEWIQPQVYTQDLNNGIWDESQLRFNNLLS